MNLNHSFPQTAGRKGSFKCSIVNRNKVKFLENYISSIFLLLNLQAKIRTTHKTCKLAFSPNVSLRIAVKLLLEISLKIAQIYLRLTSVLQYVYFFITLNNMIFITKLQQRIPSGICKNFTRS